MARDREPEERSELSPDVLREREKWDREYASLELTEEGPGLQAFNREFLRLVSELLPAGGRVLEAGCGAGWQSLALARTGRYDVHLMDVSREALNYARRIFEREGFRPALIQDDATATGKPEFDLVFNAGVLEHYTPAQQVLLLKGMKSRSRRFVLTLIPNRECYWYWLWRIAATSEGRWTFGKEVPVGDLAEAFEAAGLRLLGQAWVGAEWTEQLILGIDGLNASLREAILAVHRSPVIGPSAKGYLLASLGCVGDAPPRVPAVWRPRISQERPRESEALAALADAMALRIGMESELRASRAAFEEKRRELLAALEAAERKVRDLEEQVPSQEMQIEALRHAQAELNAVRAERDAAQARYEEVHQWAETLTERFNSQVQHAVELEARLESITGSTGWAILQKMYAVRYFLFPKGSLRERMGRSCMRTLRRARFHAARGPRALLQAAGRAVSRRRGAGQGRAARSAEHASAGAGPVSASLPAAVGEVPGLVSVILPVYNHAAMLGEAIESVLAQTYPDFELIVLNDGSTDDIDAVFRRYRGHPRVRLLTQPNQKLPKALSNAFEFARGEFHTWTSADNLMEPRLLERMVAFLREHPDVEMVYADYVAIDDRGEPLHDPAFRPQNKRRPDSPEIHLPRDPRPLNTVDDNFIGACFLYRSRAGRALGEYAPELGCEDYDYWMRMNALFRIAHLGTDEVLYRYRVHDNTLSGRARELRIAERVRALMEYERQRATFYAQPWEIVVDSATEAWVSGAERGPHTVRRVAGLAGPAESGRKRLLLLSGGTLDALPASVCGGDACLAVWFDGDPAGPYRYRAMLREGVDLCLCGGAEAAARAGLFAPNVFVARPGRAAFDLAVAFANNRLFYRRTVDPEARRRQLPEPFRPAEARPRVLVQVDRFAAGGLEQVVLDLLSVLVAKGFDPSLLVLAQAGPGLGKVRELGVPVLTLPTKHRAAHYRDLLRERRIELVNAHFSLFGSRIAAEAGVPFVQTVHSCYISMPPSIVEAYREADRYTSAYVCTSGNTAFYADLKMGLPPDKMIILPNGVNRERLAVADRAGVRSRLRSQLGLADGDFVFLHVGSIYRDKAQKVIVDALSRIRGEHPRAKLVCVGRSMDDGYLGELKEQIRRGGLDGAVVLAPFCEEVAPYYAMADAFVLPSFWEGWSLSLAEALCMNLPVIATAVGSAPDLLPRLGGRLVRPVFDSLLDLDANTLDRYLRGDHSRLVADLATAMKEVCESPAPSEVDTSLLACLDHRFAYGLYACLFDWLLQGGHVSAARPWALADVNGVPADCRACCAGRREDDATRAKTAGSRADRPAAPA